MTCIYAGSWNSTNSPKRGMDQAIVLLQRVLEIDSAYAPAAAMIGVKLPVPTQERLLKIYIEGLRKAGLPE